MVSQGNQKKILDSTQLISHIYLEKGKSPKNNFIKKYSSILNEDTLIISFNITSLIIIIFRRVHTIREVISVLVDLNEICMLLTMQRTTIKWHHILIVTTISRVITELIPLPQIGTFLS